MSAEVVKFVILGVGAAAVLAGGVYIGWRYRQKIRDEVSAWLRERNLEKTVLMSALLLFDNVFAGVDRVVRRRIVVQTQQTGKQFISEEIMTDEEISKLDPEVRKLLMTNNSVEKDIYKLVS